MMPHLILQSLDDDNWGCAAGIVDNFVSNQKFTFCNDEA